MISNPRKINAPSVGRDGVHGPRECVIPCLKKKKKKNLNFGFMEFHGEAEGLENFYPQG